jgi:hypothetical protein
MDYTTSQKKFYIASDSLEKTFDFDSVLKKLPIPDLKQTLDKYLKSIQPFVSQHEYENTYKTCNEFLNSGEGTNLQKLLHEKSKVQQCFLIFKDLMKHLFKFLP